MGLSGGWARLRLPKWIWPLLGSMALWIVGGALSGKLGPRLLLVNLTLSSFLALVALGQMTVVARGKGSFDLSIPYTLTLSAFVSAAIMNGSNGRVAAGILGGLAAGVAMGILNGLLVVGPDVPPIVATLASGYIAFSVILALEGAGHAVPAPALSGALRQERAGIAVVVVIALVIWVLVGFLLKRTMFGLDLHAMGQNDRAAYLAGSRVRSVTVGAFLLSGLIGGVAGVLLGGYDGGVFTNMGNPYLIGSLAAVVVGGTSVEGGSTGVVATILGALVMTLVVTVLEISHASIGIQDIAEGAIIVLVVGANRVVRLAM